MTRAETELGSYIHATCLHDYSDSLYVQPDMPRAEAVVAANPTQDLIALMMDRSRWTRVYFPSVKVPPPYPHYRRQVSTRILP